MNKETVNTDEIKGIKMETRTYRVTMTEELLGTKSGDIELLKKYLASKRPGGIDPDELEHLPDIDEEMLKNSSVFFRGEEGRPFIYDYQVKGFFKDAQAALSKAGVKVTAYKKIIDGLIFPSPRKIYLSIPEGKEIIWCERPLRAQTPQGERVSIARSEAAPKGTSFSMDITVMQPSLWGVIEIWLDYGRFKGFGQWRNSGKGRFTWVRID